MNDLKDILLEKQALYGCSSMILDFSLVREMDYTGLTVRYSALFLSDYPRP
jgi:hypothetical protein